MHQSDRPLPTDCARCPLRLPLPDELRDRSSCPRPPVEQCAEHRSIDSSLAGLTTYNDHRQPFHEAKNPTTFLNDMDSTRTIAIQETRALAATSRAVPASCS